MIDNIDNLEERRVELINEITTLTSRFETLWEFHPNNPNATDVVEESFLLNNKIISLRKNIGELEEKINLK